MEVFFFNDLFLWLFSCVNGEHNCVKPSRKGQSCVLCAKAKQKCVGVIWVEGNTVMNVVDTQDEVNQKETKSAAHYHCRCTRYARI